MSGRQTKISLWTQPDSLGTKVVCAVVKRHSCSADVAGLLAPNVVYQRLGKQAHLRLYAGSDAICSLCPHVLCHFKGQVLPHLESIFRPSDSTDRS